MRVELNGSGLWKRVLDCISHSKYGRSTSYIQLWLQETQNIAIERPQLTGYLQALADVGSLVVREVRPALLWALPQQAEAKTYAEDIGRQEAQMKAWRARFDRHLREMETLDAEMKK